MTGSNLIHLLMAVTICECINSTIRNSHVVQPGESLWEIAQKYGIHPEYLFRANPQVRNPDMIFPGQIIIVP